MLILGYPRRLAVSQKEVKEVPHRCRDDSVAESDIPAEFKGNRNAGSILIALTRSRIDYRSAPSGRTGLLFVEIGGNIVGFVQIVGILAFGFSTHYS